VTAPYYPGTQPGQPQQPMYPAQQPVIYTQQPGFAPAPAPQYGAPAPQYQPPPPPQYGQPPQQPAQLPPQFQGADLNARLGGPGIPPELQGRTVAEGLRFYGIMREEFARQRQQQPQPLQGQPGQQPAQPQQPAPQFSAQPRVPGQPGQPDPMRQYITDGLREVLPEMLAPLTAPITQRQVQETYGAVRQRYPDWAQYEGDIMQSLQGANAQQLSNPDVLEAAYFYAKGRGVTRGQQAPQGQPGYQPAWPPQPPQGLAPPMPQSYAAMAPAFVEGPTPPPPASYGQNGQQNDPRDELFARRFNVPVEVYRSWKMPQGLNDRLGMMKAPTPGIGPQQGNGQPQQQPQQPQWPSYPPQQFLHPGQYQQPAPPGFYQPSPNGAGYGY
jgi:hypothetical protein